MHKPKNIRRSIAALAIGALGWLNPLPALASDWDNPGTLRGYKTFCGKAKNSKTAAQAKREAKKRKNKQ